MQSIAIIDYGMGNVYSVKKAIEYVAPNSQVLITNNIDLINKADRIIFPGQGAIGACMQALYKHNLIDVIKSAYREKPFLGICLGLQLLFDYSEENNGVNGLAFIAGNIIKFRQNQLKIPHMGWNKVKQLKAHPLWYNINNDAYFYSVHSYYVAEKDQDLAIATTKYGVEFTCAIAKDNVFAVQFHPEKSQYNGLQLLKNFVNWSPLC